MISRFKNKFNNIKYQKMVSNFSYLSIITVSNKVLPLITIPYIVKTVGIENFGIIAFSYAIIAYFQLFTAYAFNLTATKYISINRNNIEHISQHFWNVISTKIVLFIISLFIFVAMLFTIEQLYIYKEVFLFSFIMILGNILMPIWFFQGIEDMKYISIFNVLSRIIYTLSIFIFIQNENDYIWIPLINSISFLLIGAYSLYFAIKKYKIYFVKTSFLDIKKQLEEGKELFISSVAVNLYSTTNIVLLGFLTNYNVVGIYTLAETVFAAFIQIIKIYNQVVYPHLAQYANEINKLHQQARKFFLLYIFILIFSTLVLFLSSETIMNLLFGSGHEESILILKILAISMLIAPLGGFFTSYLAIKSEYIVIRKITFQTMIINFIFVVPMILLFQGVGMAIVKIILALSQCYLNMKHNKELFNFNIKNLRI